VVKNPIIRFLNEYRIRPTMTILIGPAGSSGVGNINGVQEVKRLGLDAMEVEFTYGVRMSIETAKQLGEEAKKSGIKLSIHAPYYINLAAKEKTKIKASQQRILDSCERGHYFGTEKEKTPIVFHAGFYQGANKDIIYELIKESIIEIQETIKQKKWNVQLCPETTGKPSQFGDIDELVKLSKETGCGITVDFAHLKARQNGKKEYEQWMQKLKPLKQIHCHFSGIEYTEKGERKHLITEKKDIKELLDWIKQSKIDATIINESPDPIGDSIKTKELL
jgi:deoxyribonuclease IV